MKRAAIVGLFAGAFLVSLLHCIACAARGDYRMSFLFGCIAVLGLVISRIEHQGGGIT
jgi:hypothetical protein